MIVASISPHYIGCLSLWIAEPKTHIRLKIQPVLFIVDIVEIVAEKNGVFLTISRTQVQEFLRITPKVRHGSIESLRIFNHRNETHVSRSLFNCERVCNDWASFNSISGILKDILRRILRSDVSAQKNTLAINIFTINFDIALFEFASLDIFDPVSSSKQKILFFKSYVIF